RDFHVTGVQTCALPISGIIARGRLLDLLRRIPCFGLTLVRIDIRQEASRHATAVQAVAARAGRTYRQLDEAEKQRFLLEELKAGAPLMTQAMLDSDRKSTRLNSSHVKNSYAVFGLKKKIE